MALELGRETVQNQRWLVFAGHYRGGRGAGKTEVATNVRKRRKIVTDSSVSRRLFMAAAAAAPAAPVLLASDRIAVFEPPPSRVRIVAATAASVVGPARYTAAEIKQIASQGKDVQIALPANADEMNKALPEADVVFGALNAEWLAKAKRDRKSTRLNSSH